MYTDIHCHLIGKDIQTILKIMEVYKVEKCVCVSATQSDWSETVSLTKNYNNIYGAIGVHPWYVSDVSADWTDNMEKMLKYNPSLMIGEIGLDKNKPNMELQIQIFMKQLEFACKYNRPVHFHCVGAWDKILHIMKLFSNQKMPIMIAHSFSGTTDILNQLENWYFSFSKSVLNNKSAKLENCISIIPLKYILIESDNDEISNIPKIAEQIAKIKALPIETVIKEIYNNSQRILNNEQIT